MTLKNLIPIIKYRKFKASDYESYAVFCRSNFGKKNYQLNRSYIEWHYSDLRNGSFSVAVCENTILGIMHKFKVPILINDEPKIITVLHDLMVDTKHRGGIGFHLMQSGLKSDDYVVLPGSIGRLSRAYGRLGSKSFDSFWYRKFQIPKSFFTLKKLKDLNKYQNLAKTKNLLFGHNKESNDDFLTKALKKYNNIDFFSSYFEWRFFNKNSPLTFYVTDERSENTALFVVGKRGLLPYVRIFYVHSGNSLILNDILNFIEIISSRIGIPIILFTSFESPPPSQLKYKIYSEIPISYVYSKNKNYDFIPEVPSFCSDIGFDGLNPF